MKFDTSLRRLHWIYALFFFFALAMFIYRIPLFHGDPFHYLEVANDLEPPPYLSNLITSYYPTWNELLGTTNYVNAFQIDILIFLPFAFVLNIPAMTTVLLIFVTGTALFGFFGYLALYHIISRRYGYSPLVVAACLVAGLFLLFNPLWATDVLHPAEKIATAFAPIMFLLFWMGFRDKKFTYILGGTVMMVLYSAVPRNIISAAFLFAALEIFALATDIFSKTLSWKASMTTLMTYLKYFVGAVGAFCMLDAYEVFPLLYRTFTIGFPVPYLPSIEAAQSGVSDANVFNALRFDLYQKYVHRTYVVLPGTLQNPQVLAFIFFLAFVPFFSALAMLFVGPRDREVRLLLVNLVVWTCVSTGINALGFPFVPDLYYWLLFQIPFYQFFYWAFRSPVQFWFLSLMFGAILVGYFCFRLLRVLANVKVPRKVKVLAAFGIVLILTSIILPSWPLLTGNMNGILQPIRVPDDFYVVNSWLSSLPGDFKVLWLPYYTPGLAPWGAVSWVKNQTDPLLAYSAGLKNYEMFSSLRPTYSVWVTPTAGPPMQSFLINILSLNYGYPFDIVQSNRTMRLGQLLSPANIRYVVVNAGIAPNKALELNYFLSTQVDLRLVKVQGIYSVYENLDDMPHVYSTPRTILIQGGRETQTAISNLPMFYSKNVSLVFLDQQTPANPTEFELSDTIFLHDWRGLLPQVDPSDVIPLTGFTLHEDTFFQSYWAKAEVNDFRYAVWTSVLTKNRVANWDMDYGIGFIFTNRTNTEISFPTSVSHDDDYDVLLRYLPNRSGGAFSVAVDGVQLATIRTLSNATSFTIADLGFEKLEKGAHTITVRNLQGFNALNFFMLVPKERILDYQSQIFNMLSDKQLVYLELPGSNFDYVNATLTQRYGGSAMNGEALFLNNGGVAWSSVEPTRAGMYVLAISNPNHLPLSAAGGLLVQISNYTIRIDYPEGSSQRFVYTKPFHLDQRKYQLTVSRLYGSPAFDGIFIASASEPDTTLNRILGNETGAQIEDFSRISPTEYSVIVNTKRPFWLYLAEAYDPGWVAQVGGSVVNSVIANQGINAFPINMTGRLSILVRYSLQSAYDLGSLVSVSTLVFMIVVVLADSRKRYKSIASRSELVISSYWPFG